MRIETIDELADILAQSQLTSLELEGTEWSIQLQRTAVEVRPSVPPPTSFVAAAAPVDAQAPDMGVAVVEAGMVGVFHDATPRVPPGKTVRAGDLLGTIDALTIRNDVRAETDGEVVSVHVEDGQPVEYGQPLFGVTTSGGGQ